MNKYRIEFFAKCPSNGLRIKYALQIQVPADKVVHAEVIHAQIEQHTTRPVLHEELADQLARVLPGKQTMIAEHHGVTIETERNAC